VNSTYDILIIGGGINGAGIARDAAGRGLRVILFDKGKVGQATSSWSTKLIHGGLRYLEDYNFKLVHESLKEREIINYIAPNITNHLPFIIPHSNQLRPAWLIKLGLILYDNIGGKSSLPKSQKINIENEYPNILKSNYKMGFKYFDLQVNDQKLVELNIQDAKKRGATICENKKVVKCERNKEYWDIYLDDKTNIKTKIVVNATGPWVNEVMKKILKINSPKSLRLVKGSHIIIKKLYKKNIAFTLQNNDKRIIFVIPYKDDYTLIGTTEIEVSDPNNPNIDRNEIDYLINCVNNYFIKKINEKDIIETYSGIRPLIEDFSDKASSISRDYIFDINTEKNLAPVLNIFGGKLTTYRKLSTKALNELSIFFDNFPKDWTHKKKLI